MRSLYSQQQTHGLRLADTTCLSLQHPPRHPNLSALTKPSVSRNSCLQTRAPKEQHQERKQTSQTRPQLCPRSPGEQCVTGGSFRGRLPAFPSFHLSSCLASSASLRLFIKTVKSLDRGRQSDAGLGLLDFWKTEPRQGVAYERQDRSKPVQPAVSSEEAADWKRIINWVDVNVRATRGSCSSRLFSLSATEGILSPPSQT